MIVIGLTGSIAMGKSEVAKVFREHGIPVFDSDQEVHALYDSAEGAELLKGFVPQAIVDDRVSRSKLSEAVIEDKTLLEKLETIVHAEILRRRKNFIAAAEVRASDCVLVDVPLLFEKGHEKDIDITIVVSSSAATQRKRALERPTMTEAKLEMILKRQMPDAEKRKRANIIIENDGTLEDLRTATEAVIQRIRKRTS
jgi:dephospho-CoA kinase